jgi:hypothetical protein
MICACHRVSMAVFYHTGSMIGLCHKENKTVHGQVSSVNCTDPSEQVSSLGNIFGLVSTHNKVANKRLYQDINRLLCSGKRNRQKIQK